MYLKTIKPTYHGSSTEDKLSMLISYVEELGDEISFRLESLSSSVADLKKEAVSKNEST